MTLSMEVSANGNEVSASGTALVIVSLETDSERGQAAAELVAARGADHIEQYGPTFVYGADSVALRFIVPSGVADLTIRSQDGPGLGNASTIEVYNFAEEQFVEISAREAFSAAGVISPLGEVMVRLSYGEFEFGEVWIEAVRLDWSTP